MAVILIIIAILFLVLLGWSWNSLGSIDKKEKIKYIIIGLVLTYLLTFIIYAISKIGIQYDNKEAMKIIRTVFVLLFAIVNGSPRSAAHPSPGRCASPPARSSMRHRRPWSSRARSSAAACRRDKSLSSSHTDRSLRCPTTGSSECAT